MIIELITIKITFKQLFKKSSTFYLLRLKIKIVFVLRSLKIKSFIIFYKETKALLIVLIIKFNSQKIRLKNECNYNNWITFPKSGRFLEMNEIAINR